ncbi:MAG: hypothetical protein HAW67_07235 [Endozoicomonadaceae bacterium]|nr:hypothetical protein [Endozoicomonadaceae bacterium]
MNKRLLVLVMLGLALCDNAYAVGEKTQAFTSEFIRCAQRYSSDKSTYETDGVAASALMNGSSILAVNNNDYWNYMDCLSPSVSGNVPLDLPVATLCAGKEVIHGKRRFYLPSGKVGLTAQLDSVAYICNASGWVQVGSVTDDHSACSSQSFTVSNCSFFFEPSKHSDVRVVKFQGNSREGSATAICKNGSFQLLGANCVSSTCASNQTISWYGSGGTKCEGNIASTGAVLNDQASLRYFPSMNGALRYTRIKTGSAQFICRKNRWVEVSSTCQRKAQNTLTCQSRTVNSRLEYACR